VSKAGATGGFTGRSAFDGSRPPVPGKDRRSLANWFSNHKNAIAAAETEYVQHAEDLFAIVPKSKTPLRRFMERSQHFRLFRGWMKPSPVDDENVHYTSDQRIDMFVNIVIALIGLIMLIETSTCDHHVFRCGVPVLRVIYDCGTAIRDAWSSCCVSLSVSARFIATDNSLIRYAAVLVVFLQISP
jgi:hypothetical protein